MTLNQLINTLENCKEAYRAGDYEIDVFTDLKGSTPDDVICRFSTPTVTVDFDTKRLHIWPLFGDEARP